MTIADLNKMETSAVITELTACCGSSKWVRMMLEKLPFADEVQLIRLAEKIWYDECDEPDWLEAFTHHPKIGDVKGLTEKFASTRHLAGKEQSGVETASAQTIEQLATANQQYEAKFGFIFIVCATGKSAAEMLRLLQDRLRNSREEELMIAMGEQHKITLIRLKKYLSEANYSKLAVSQITTHVLDTSIGKPGKDITIKLQASINNHWLTITQGVTNADGRIPDLLPAERKLKQGNYKMVFETEAYFGQMNTIGFYPLVEIQFTVFDNSHYHVPLLINPFGFSTYRGS